MPRGDSQRKLTTAQIDEIVRRYVTRLPDGTWEGVPSIAKDFSVSYSTVSRWLKIRGVALRSPKEAHVNGERCKPITRVPVGEAPLCKCGCGVTTIWNQRKNRWNLYVTGHYRKNLPYKDANWLYEEYVTKKRGLIEISRQFGVNESAVSHFLDKYGIPRQPVDHLKKGSRGEKNGSWRGGVAQWEYSSDWKSLARSMRIRDKWTCQDCKEQRKRWGIYLHVHHVDCDKTNNDPNNLISLCADCHMKRHAALSKKTPH
jgi:hypothetical protein